MIFKNHVVWLKLIILLESFSFCCSADLKLDPNISTIQTSDYNISKDYQTHLNTTLSQSDETYEIPSTEEPGESVTTKSPVQQPSMSRFVLRTSTKPPVKDKCSPNWNPPCIQTGQTLTCRCRNDSVESILSSQPNLDEFTSIKIRDSYIPTLNLNLFVAVSNLQSLSVTHSQVSQLVGTIPASLMRLNLSSNSLEVLQSSAFLQATSTELVQNPTSPPETADKTGTEGSSFEVPESREMSHSQSQHKMRIEMIDLSNNKIPELPKSIFDLQGFNMSVFIAGNNIDRSFVWDQLYDWTKHSWTQNISTSDFIIKDADYAMCQSKDDFPNFKFSVFAVLKAKHHLEDICSSPNILSKCRDCTLFALQKDLESRRPDYPISHKGPGGSSISLSLSLDCSESKLTELPRIPLQTWYLNVTANQITSLAPLTSDNYKYLEGLYADHNQININTLPAGAPFLGEYTHLSLRHNQIDTLPLSILQSLKSLQNNIHRFRNERGQTHIGGNPIDCGNDCSTFLDIQNFLRKYKRNMDSKEIFCKNLAKEVAIVDIRMPEICRIANPNESETWVTVVIVLEVLLIVAIITKVWYDQRVYRRTGKLPWISQIMPRLPWDTVLEGLKDIKEHQNKKLSNSQQANTSTSLGSFQFLTLKRKNSVSKSKKTKSVRFKTSRSNSDASQAQLETAKLESFLN